MNAAGGGDVPVGVLNAHQKRHFEVVLGMLEDLRRLEQVAQGGPAGGVLTIIDDDLPTGYAAHAEPTLAAIRHRVATLAAALELQPRRVSRRRTIRALLTAEVVRLEDSSAAQLRGYGSVDPRFVETVAPALAEIIEQLRVLSSRLGADARPAK